MTEPSAYRYEGTDGETVITTVSEEHPSERDLFTEGTLEYRNVEPLYATEDVDGDQMLKTRLKKLEHRQKDMIHVADLRELIQEWETAEEQALDQHAGQAAGILRSCIDDLEGLIDE